MKMELHALAAPETRCYGYIFGNLTLQISVQTNFYFPGFHFSIGHDESVSVTTNLHHAHFLGSQLYFSPLVAGRLTPFRPSEWLHSVAVVIARSDKKPRMTVNVFLPEVRVIISQKIELNNNSA